MDEAQVFFDAKNIFGVERSFGYADSKKKDDPKLVTGDGVSMSKLKRFVRDSPEKIESYQMESEFTKEYEKVNPASFGVDPLPFVIENLNSKEKTAGITMPQKPGRPRSTRSPLKPSVEKGASSGKVSPEQKPSPSRKRKTDDTPFAENQRKPKLSRKITIGNKLNHMAYCESFTSGSNTPIPLMKSKIPAAKKTVLEASGVDFEREENHPGEKLTIPVGRKTLDKNYRNTLLYQSGISLQSANLIRNARTYNARNIPQKSSDVEFLSERDRESFSGASVTINLADQELFKPKTSSVFQRRK